MAVCIQAILSNWQRSIYTNCIVWVWAVWTFKRVYRKYCFCYRCTYCAVTKEKA